MKILNNLISASELFGLHFPVREEFSVDGKTAGDVMPDGTIYVGTVKGRAVFTTPEDEGARLSFGEAFEGARKKRAYGRSDWRIPRSEELQAMFASSAIKGFTADRPDDYWSIEDDPRAAYKLANKELKAHRRETPGAIPAEDQIRSHVRYVRGSRLKAYLCGIK